MRLVPYRDGATSPDDERDRSKALQRLPPPTRITMKARTMPPTIDTERGTESVLFDTKLCQNVEFCTISARKNPAVTHCYDGVCE